MVDRHVGAVGARKHLGVAHIKKAIRQIQRRDFFLFNVRYADIAFAMFADVAKKARQVKVEENKKGMKN